VRLTALLRIDVGPTRERQALTQQLDRGRRTTGSKANEATLRALFANGGMPNPFGILLREQDSLKLTVSQADSLATINRSFLIALESIWPPMLRDFAALPDGYDHDEVYHRYVIARRNAVDLMRTLAPRVRSLLSEEQMRRLPPLVAMHLDARYLTAIRSGTAGFGGWGPPPSQGMGGGGVGGGVQVIGRP
jgi:hypothetical protein